MDGLIFGRIGAVVNSFWTTRPLDVYRKRLEAASPAGDADLHHRRIGQ
jgi:hypothetical protein